MSSLASRRHATTPNRNGVQRRLQEFFSNTADKSKSPSAAVSSPSRAGRRDGNDGGSRQLAARELLDDDALVVAFPSTVSVRPPASSRKRRRPRNGTRRPLTSTNVVDLTNAGGDEPSIRHGPGAEEPQLGQAANPLEIEDSDDETPKTVAIQVSRSSTGTSSNDTPSRSYTERYDDPVHYAAADKRAQSSIPLPISAPSPLEENSRRPSHAPAGERSTNLVKGYGSSIDSSLQPPYSPEVSTTVSELVSVWPEAGRAVAHPLWLDRRKPCTPAVRQIDTQLLAELKIHVRSKSSSLRTVLTTTDELLACDVSFPGGFCDAIVVELLTSRCRARTECLRRLLRLLLRDSDDCWRPPEHEPGYHGGWLDDLMAVITGEGHTCAPRQRDAALSAHAAVLEVVLDFLGAGLDESLWPVRGTQESCTLKLRQLFKWAGEDDTQESLDRSARRAIAKCTRWAIDIWASTMRRESSAPDDEAALLNCPTHAWARLLTAQLLAVVVETCGLQERDVCAVIRDEIKRDRLVTAAGVSSGNDRARGLLVTGVLDAAALAGFVRTICARPFCVVLARLLGEELEVPRDGEVGLETAGLARLLARLSSRAQGGDALLSL